MGLLFVYMKKKTQYEGRNDKQSFLDTSEGYRLIPHDETFEVSGPDIEKGNNNMSNHNETTPWSRSSSPATQDWLLVD